MGWPLRPWLVSIIVIVIVVVGLLTLPQAPSANAAPNSLPLLDCLKCHPRTLELHDSLGSENNACWVCFEDVGIEIDEEVGHTPYLLLADDTLLSLEDSSQLCGQCHQRNYKLWKEGIHEIPGDDKARCVDCHDPHKPQIALLDITEPHPPPVPSPSPPSVVLLALLGSSLLVIMALGVVTRKKGKGA